MPIRCVDGRDACAACELFGESVWEMRAPRQPLVVVLRRRATGQSHQRGRSDDLPRAGGSRALAARRATRLPLFGRWLLATAGPRRSWSRSAARLSGRAGRGRRQAAAGPEPEPVLDASRPLQSRVDASVARAAGTSPTGLQLIMRDAIREVLRDRLRCDPSVWLFGEDIEDPKGDVFGVTKGLSTEFPGRVRNSPLTESTIIGSAIGRALAGQRPVAFIQFADFLPLALQPADLRTGHDVLADRGPLERAVDRHDRLRRVSSRPGAVPRPDDGFGDRSHARGWTSSCPRRRRMRPAC